MAIRTASFSKTSRGTNIRTMAISTQTVEGRRFITQCVADAGYVGISGMGDPCFSFTSFYRDQTQFAAETRLDVAKLKPMYGQGWPYWEDVERGTGEPTSCCSMYTGRSRIESSRRRARCFG